MQTFAEQRHQIGLLKHQKEKNHEHECHCNIWEWKQKQTNKQQLIGTKEYIKKSQRELKDEEKACLKRWKTRLPKARENAPA